MRSDTPCFSPALCAAAFFLFLLALAAPVRAAFAPDTDYLADRALLDEVQRDAFRYMWEYCDADSGMAVEADYDWERKPIAVGGSGFGIAAIVVATDRGWITRGQAIERLMKITLFLRDTTQRAEMHGAFPHWIDGATGKAVEFGSRDSSADLVETSFLMQGLLIARAYFNGPGVEEKLRSVITELWEDVEWDWFDNGEENGLYWHWDAERGFHHGLKILGYNECLVTYVLAASSPTHPISRKTYDYWTSGVDYLPRDISGYRVEAASTSGGPLFLAQYSFIGLNPRLIADDYVTQGYFVRNVLHTLSNRGYCLYEAPAENRYSGDFWGLSAGHTATGYRAADPANDGGAVAPTAAIASMPYTPEYSLRVLANLAGPLRKRVWGAFGPRDGVSLRDDWASEFTLAIDQLPMVCMVENYRSGLLWDLFMGDKDVRQGLERAGLGAPEHAEGFPEAIIPLRPETEPDGDSDGYALDAYDARRHPDTGVYGIPYFVKAAGKVRFSIADVEGTEVFARELDAAAESGVLSFPQFMPRGDGVLTLRMVTGAGEYFLPLRLR